jgi:hypothetical protein
MGLNRGFRACSAVLSLKLKITYFPYWGVLKIHGSVSYWAHVKISMGYQLVKDGCCGA